jgi:hypothetical protein
MPNKLTRKLTMHKLSNKAQQIGAELVVRTLEMQGVTHVFGIPGAKIDAVFNALVDSTIKTVVCRHEQNAAFIAGGIGLPDTVHSGRTARLAVLPIPPAISAKMARAFIVLHGESRGRRSR